MELSQHPVVSVVCMYELSMYQQQWDILTHRIMVGQYGAYLRLIDLLRFALLLHTSRSVTTGGTCLPLNFY